MLDRHVNHEHIIYQGASMGSVFSGLWIHLNPIVQAAALIVPTVYYGVLLYDHPRVQRFIKRLRAKRR